MAGQYGSALTHIRTACDLNPCDSWTCTFRGFAHGFLREKRTPPARSPARRSDLTLAPTRTQWSYQIDIEFLGGNYEAAVVAADQAQHIQTCGPAWRAAALAHLGRIAKATKDAQLFLDGIKRNWFGTAAATDATITCWMLHQYPIARASDWERLRDGLRLAGLPTGSLAYAQW